MSVASTFLTTDDKVKFYTGLPSKQAFDGFYQYLYKNAKKITGKEQAKLYLRKYRENLRNHQIRVG